MAVSKSDILHIAVSVLECREDFYREEMFNTCVPICPSWKQDSKEISAFIDAVVIITFSIGFVISVVILVIAAIRHKTM